MEITAASGPFMNPTEMNYMRIQLKLNSARKVSLTDNKKYFVFAIETDREGDTVYRVENDQKSLLPYSAALFDVVSAKVIPGWQSWRANEESSPCWLPHEFAYLGYWEDFYNDEPEALARFNAVKQQMVQYEWDEHDVLEVFKLGDEDEIHFVLTVLIQAEDSRHIHPVIVWVESWFEQMVYRENPSVLLAFRYLSLFRQRTVEDFFIAYLNAIEVNRVSLTAVVNDYFS
jgi:hypothetical protein